MGYQPLQEAVADYLHASRGATCTPEQVAIVSGLQEGLDVASRLLLEPGDAVCLESPEYMGAALVFEAHRAKVIAVPVDGEGMAVPSARHVDARLVYVTPGHQAPLGTSMSLPRRQALLEWARRSGALIFEDDYDSEYRYARHPLPALQGLDRSQPGAPAADAGDLRGAPIGAAGERPAAPGRTVRDRGRGGGTADGGMAARRDRRGGRRQGRRGEGRRRDSPRPLQPGDRWRTRDCSSGSGRSTATRSGEACGTSRSLSSGWSAGEPNERGPRLRNRCRQRRVGDYMPSLPYAPTGALLPALLLAAVLASPAAAQSMAGCGADSTYAALDFWVGSWSVYVGDTLVGTNRISKVLHGCAVVEEWRDAEGGEGRSLFYVEPALRQWKQVWVTDAALHVGGLKEKHLIARVAGGGVRFQGELRRPDGRLILDRTTLTPTPGGQVRQLIEISTDGGTSWRPTFDARYRRAS